MERAAGWTRSTGSTGVDGWKRVATLLSTITDARVHLGVCAHVCGYGRRVPR